MTKEPEPRQDLAEMLAELDSLLEKGELVSPDPSIWEQPGLTDILNNVEGTTVTVGSPGGRLDLTVKDIIRSVILQAPKTKRVPLLGNTLTTLL